MSKFPGHLSKYINIFEDSKIYDYEDAKTQGQGFSAQCGTLGVVQLSGWIQRAQIQPLHQQLLPGAPSLENRGNSPPAIQRVG